MKRQAQSQPATRGVAGWRKGRAAPASAWRRVPACMAGVAVPETWRRGVLRQVDAVAFMSEVTFSGPETRNPAPLPVRGSDRSVADFFLRASSSRTCGLGNKDEYEERGTADRRADRRGLREVEGGGVALHAADINMDPVCLSTDGRCLRVKPPAGRIAPARLQPKSCAVHGCRRRNAQRRRACGHASACTSGWNPGRR